MKAIIHTKYGASDVLTLAEIPRPVPKGREVLVKIQASAINDYDWAVRRGKPYVYRLMFGLLKPKKQVPGMELAGTVEALGPQAVDFAVGDAVYGDISEYGFGAFAQYICIDERALRHMPEAMTFEEAAAIPHASGLAVQGLIDVGKIQPGQHLLINGAGGGVGTFALQIAKQFEAEVTGVDTGSKLEMMQDLGFDHIIDYKKEDFTKSGRRYDLILDTKTNRSPFAYAGALKEKGKYVTVGGNLPALLQLLLLKPWIAYSKNKSLHLVSLKANKDLSYINELFEAGKIRPIIDGPYGLAQVPEAVEYFGQGRHQGKIIIANQQLTSDTELPAF